MTEQEDKTKRDCFGYKKGECMVLTDLICKDAECTFFKTRKQFLEDAERARQTVERRKNNAK